MPLLIDTNNVVQRVTFDNKPAIIDNNDSWLRLFMNSFWRLVSGG